MELGGDKKRPTESSNANMIGGASYLFNDMDDESFADWVGKQKNIFHSSKYNKRFWLRLNFFIDEISLVPFELWLILLSYCSVFDIYSFQFV